ncbi:MAG: hypothetical protein DDT22_00912 [candidate division WS2 bacterium]|nr:hypothetical protein [Candidatus Lithacetigena glycinireducens]MBT9175238.1 hypothetical protein [Candidatus Lithacetigena glycinireducens]
MTVKEAKKYAEKYYKAEIWFCPKAKQAEVMVYSGRHSSQWYKWTGEWRGSSPAISGCTCSWEERRHSHVYYNQNGKEI